MKRIALLLIVIITALSVPYEPYGKTAFTLDDDSGIPINQNTGSGIIPKGNSAVPINCRLSDTCEELEFGFTADLGIITISVYNITSGQYTTTQVDTQIGNSTIQIPGTTGYFYIDIVATGTSYYGEFTL